MTEQIARTILGLTLAVMALLFVADTLHFHQFDHEKMVIVTLLGLMVKPGYL